ncbi:MAG: hypothetical protein B7X04_00545 [Parcubacteria group bacterium 21-54-25]|nr:MAG: hypothetical protein B7X04_00545 [Parcubacteria group bacterium 21-54-25]HQU07457.1 glycosyltransferase family 4 protein [Candidatus Paceibacterota bacterium]
MRLVIATPLYPPEPGGPATYAKVLAEGLPERGIEAALVKFSDVRHLPKLVRHVAYFGRVRRALRGADAVLVLDPVSTGLPACLAAWSLKKPLVVKVVGDYAWEQGRQRFGVTAGLDTFVKTKKVPIAVRFLRKVQTGVAHRARAVIVPSAYLKGIVKNWGIPEEKIHVVYNGVELTESLPTPKRPKGLLVVSSGRRVPWKGFEALGRVVAREPSWHLHIASDVSPGEARGWVRAADVFVLNSTYEGLSHALIEAMMLGTPIIATAVGGNPELIKDGVTGLLVPPGDDDALHAALQQVDHDPAAARTRAAAAQKAAARLTPAAMIENTAALIRSNLPNLGHGVS